MLLIPWASNLMPSVLIALETLLDFVHLVDVNTYAKESRLFPSM